MTTTHADGRTTATKRRAPMIAALIVAAALIGTAVFVGAGRLGSDDDAAAPGDGASSAEARTTPTDPADLTEAGFRELPAVTATVPEAPATDAQAAVVGFLTAEANADFEASYRFLATEDQELYGSPAGWIAEHASVMPPITGYVLGEITDGADAAQVASTVGFRPSLDEIVGLVPAQADVVWEVVDDAGTFGVSLERSTLTPRFIDDADVAEQAATWVASRQDCAPSGEWGGTLLGVQGPVLELCDTPGDVEVAEVTALDQLEATPFVTAFGEDSLTWARVVEIEAPLAFRAVLAPIGSEWRVIGALPEGALVIAPPPDETS